MKRIALLFLILLCGTALQEVMGQKGVEDKRNAYNNRRFYARNTRLRNHVILLQLAQLPMNLRGSYEYRFNKMFMAGIHASVRFAGKEAGTIKSEIYGKYFTNNKAPQGLYIYAETGIALARNHTITKNIDVKSITSEANLTGILPTTITQRESFFSFCGGSGFGFQNVFGQGRRTMIDFALGYRWYHIPSRLKNPVRDEERKLEYTEIKPNFSPLSTLSPFTFRFGLGYMF